MSKDLFPWQHQRVTLSASVLFNICYVNEKLRFPRGVTVQCVYVLDNLGRLSVLALLSRPVVLLGSGLTCFVCISVVVLQLSQDGRKAVDRSRSFGGAKITL